MASFLDQNLKRWSLAVVESTKKAHLKYLIRLRKETTP